MSCYNELLFVQVDDSCNINAYIHEEFPQYRDNDWPTAAFLKDIVRDGSRFLCDDHAKEETYYFGSKGIDPYEFYEKTWLEWDSRFTSSFDVYYRTEGSDDWKTLPTEDVVLDPDEARELLETMDNMWNAINMVDRQFHKNPKAISVYNKILRKIGVKK